MILPRLDELTFLSATIEQEAGGEPWLGMLGVGHVAMNRLVRRWRGAGSLLDVLLDRSQFSCWREDSPTRMRLDSIGEVLWRECLAAAAGSIFRHELGIVDPTNGAVFYLNIPVVLKAAGRLPSWCALAEDPRQVDSAKVLAVHGQHTFIAG